jgi:hypothetical protein
MTMGWLVVSSFPCALAGDPIERISSIQNAEKVIEDDKVDGEIWEKTE